MVPMVVETTNLAQGFRGSNPDSYKMVERFTRVAPDTIEYRFTVDDPTVWTGSWTAAFPMHRSGGPVYEYACHQGNARSMEGILRASAVQRQ